MSSTRPCGPIVIDTDVFSADLVPGSRIAERYAPIITGRPAFISFQTATARAIKADVMNRLGDGVASGASSSVAGYRELGEGYVECHPDRASVPDDCLVDVAAPF